jgi:hypothetical protein
MSKVVQLLEAMAQLAHADIEQLLTQADINAEQADTIRTKDIISLERQLDICPDIFCFLIPAEDDQPVKEDEENEESSINSVVNG